jgi:hypothetical protein
MAYGDRPRLHRPAISTSADGRRSLGRRRNQSRPVGWCRAHRGPSPLTGWARTLWLGIVTLSVTVACSGNDNEADPTGTATTTLLAAPVIYGELRNPSWERSSAVRILRRPAALAAAEPSLDWWAEYLRRRPTSGGTESEDIRLSGHHVDVETHVAELKMFDSEPTQIGEWPAVVAIGVDGKPAVISIEVDDDYTIMALSYALTSDELTVVAAALATMTEDRWLASGGQIIDCDPSTPDCPPATT